MDIKSKVRDSSVNIKLLCVITNEGRGLGLLCLM